MNYTKQQFLEDVATEARLLKEHATQEERNRLNFDQLDPNRPMYCIYGQMTFNCFSQRASQLILKCCKRYFNIINADVKSIEDVSKVVNGSIPVKLNTHQH